MKKPSFKWFDPIGVLIVLFIFAFNWCGIALADGSWIQPAVGVVEDTKGGLLTIGIPLVGNGIIFVGIVGGIMGKIDWGKVAYIVIGGIFVTAGPKALEALLKMGT